MFDRYTQHALRVIFFARYEASRLGDEEIDTQHLLLGILREDRALLLDYLDNEQLALLASQIEADAKQRNQGKGVSTQVDLPLTPYSKAVLQNAEKEAESLGDKHIGSEHLFLGLLRETDSCAGKLLQQRGLQFSTILERFRSGAAKRLIPEPPRSRETRLSSKSPRERVRTARDCIEFIDVETGERVGIIGLHWNYPIPRVTDFVRLQPGEAHMDVRYEVLDVVFEYERQMPSLPYRIEHLKNVTVRVRRADQRRSGFAEST